MPVKVAITQITVEPLQNDHWSSTIIPFIRPDFVWRTVFSVCAVPDRRPSLRCDHRPNKMEFSLSRTTTSIQCIHFQEPRVALQNPFPMVDYYNVALKHLWSNSIDLNFLIICRRCKDVLDRRCNVIMLPARRRSRCSNEWLGSTFYI